MKKLEIKKMEEIYGGATSCFSLLWVSLVNPALGLCGALYCDLEYNK
jgi:hypothetical protein